MRTITINLYGIDYTVELNDSKMAERFASMAPFKTSVTEYSSNHYWGAVPKKIEKQKELKTSQPVKGGFYYADHTTSLAVFYDDSRSIAPYEIYHLGNVVGDLSALKTTPYEIECTVKLND